MKKNDKFKELQSHSLKSVGFKEPQMYSPLHVFKRVKKKLMYISSSMISWCTQKKERVNPLVNLRASVSPLSYSEPKQLVIPLIPQGLAQADPRTLNPDPLWGYQGVHGSASSTLSSCLPPMGLGVEVPDTGYGVTQSVNGQDGPPERVGWASSPNPDPRRGLLKLPGAFKVVTSWFPLLTLTPRGGINGYGSGLWGTGPALAAPPYPSAKARPGWGIPLTIATPCGCPPWPGRELRGYVKVSENLPYPLQVNGRRGALSSSKEGFGAHLNPRGVRASSPWIPPSGVPTLPFRPSKGLNSLKRVMRRGVFHRSHLGGIASKSYLERFRFQEMDPFLLGIRGGLVVRSPFLYQKFSNRGLLFAASLLQKGGRLTIIDTRGDLYSLLTLYTGADLIPSLYQVDSANRFTRLSAQGSGPKGPLPIKGGVTNRARVGNPCMLRGKGEHPFQRYQGVSVPIVPLGGVNGKGLQVGREHRAEGGDFLKRGEMGRRIEFYHSLPSHLSASGERWIGGTLTNWKDISKKIYQFGDISQKLRFSPYPKRRYFPLPGLLPLKWSSSQGSDGHSHGVPTLVRNNPFRGGTALPPIRRYKKRESAYPGFLDYSVSVSTSEMRNFLSNFPTNEIKSFTEAIKVSPPSSYRSPLATAMGVRPGWGIHPEGVPTLPFREMGKTPTPQFDLREIGKKDTGGTLPYTPHSNRTPPHFPTKHTGLADKGVIKSPALDLPTLTLTPLGVSGSSGLTVARASQPKGELPSTPLGSGLGVSRGLLKLTGDFPFHAATKRVQLEGASGLARLQKGRLRFKKKPDAIFLINPNRNKGVINEAATLKIPVIAFVDSDTDPKGITHPIPVNIYSFKESSLFLLTLVRIAALLQSKKG